jgi:O-antigen ligase
MGRLAAALAAAVLLVWRIFPSFADMYWLRLSNTAEFFFTATEGVLSGRVSSWRTLAEWLSANPWQALFGIGYKTLPYTNYLGGPVVADNMYLSLLVETGIAGLAAVIWLNIAILRASARAARSADSRTSFCGTWMLCFWCGQVVQMFSGDLLTYWRVLPVYFWVLALAVRV